MSIDNSSVYMNSMTDLVNKIDMRLGTALIPLPEKLSKKVWPTIIDQTSLVTFSRYFPHKMTIYIDSRLKTKGGWYIVNEFMPKNVKLISIGDINWAEFGHYVGAEQSLGWGCYDFLADNFGMDDVGLLQMRADHMSVFNNTIFVKVQKPNKVRFQTINNRDVTRYLSVIPLEIMVKHFSDLSTISPGLMEEFEELATEDIATFLYHQLKFFDKVETVFGANVELYTDHLLNWADKRESTVESLKNNAVSAGNMNYRFILSC